MVYSVDIVFIFFVPEILRDKVHGTVNHPSPAIVATVTAGPPAISITVLYLSFLVLCIQPLQSAKKDRF